MCRAFQCSAGGHKRSLQMTLGTRWLKPRGIPWRLFRHDAAKDSAIPAWLFVAAYLAGLLLAHFCQTRFGTVAVWPANGILVAAMLLLNRKQAAATFVGCVALNFAFNLGILKTGFDSSLIFPTLNAFEVFWVAFVARRFCGGALKLNRPNRMARFALLAAAPTVCVAATIGLAVIGIKGTLFWPYFASWVSAELLPILIIAPCIIMLSQRQQLDAALHANRTEASLLIGLACLGTAAVCLDLVPLPVAVVLPVLMLISMRLNARQAATLVLSITTLATSIFLLVPHAFDTFELVQHISPNEDISELTLDLPAFYMFLASAVLVIFSISTAVNEKTRLHLQVQARATKARKDAEDLKAATKLAEQASEAKRRFLGMISHELRTPLGQVAGFTGLVAQDTGLSAQSLDLVGKISMANAHALMLVDDMIDFARADIGLNLEPFDLRELLSGVIDLVRNNLASKPIEVVFENHLESDGYFVGDGRRIHQLLRLLLHNAVKFTEAGQIGVRVMPTPSGARLVVFDTGVGISPDKISYLQEAFTQDDSSLARTREGTGIGLALAGRIMSVLDGSWEFDSQVGQGTRITIDLPMQRAQRPQEVSEAPARPPKVLVVDDHPANREILGLILRSMGCETDYASDGQEAVDAARQGNPDIIFMDLRMPRMDGYEASREIRALEGEVANVPILAVSAECRDDSLADCKASGMDGFLSKPVSQDTLYESVVKWLDPVTARNESPLQPALSIG